MLCPSSAVVAQTTAPPSLTTIDFENVSGPTVFSNANPSLTISSATFTGGQILSQATFLPADPTTVYGTSYFCGGCNDTIQIDFAQKVSNFSMLLLNGLNYTVTYTVEDDQGGKQQITLIANNDSGAMTMTLPETGIRQVMISADPNTWDFEIDNIQFSPTNASLIDPVASGFITQYANGASISTDTDLLATGGKLVQGASADGVTQVLIRIPSSQAGVSLNLSVQDANGSSTDAASIGGLFKLGDLPKNAAQSLTLTTVDTTSGPMAFAVYLAPVNFSHASADDTASSRAVTLQVGTSNQVSSSINIVRPPVVLVHGLWGSSADWNNFSPIVGSSSYFYVAMADYSGYVAGITATKPSYSFVNQNKIGGNALGFDFNASQVEKLIRSYINDYKTTANVAAVQADVVGHSMGGDVSRDLATLQDFADGRSYGQGIIDKLITVGTPHLGSPLATDLLNGSNGCSAGVLATAGKPSFTSVTVNGAAVSGAVNDLAGAGDGTGLSNALMKLQLTALPFPMAYIGATSTSANWTNLGKSLFSPSYFLRSVWCTNDPVAQALTPTGWPTLFNGGSSDSVVTQNSQLNGSGSGAGGPFTGIIHSSGLESLDFLPPAELDSAAQIANQVVSLLNEAKDGSDFHIYGGSQ